MLYVLSTKFMTDGRGTGNWRKLSVSIPQYVRTSMRLKQVYRFPEDAVSLPPPSSPPRHLVPTTVSKHILGSTSNSYFRSGLCLQTPGDQGPPRSDSSRK